jgi:hypothetical protein
MKEFRYIGLHAGELEGGRPLAPGEYTGPISERAPHNTALIDAGHLLPVEDGTADRVAQIDAATERKGEPLTDEEHNYSKTKLATVGANEEKKGDD